MTHRALRGSRNVHSRLAQRSGAVVASGTIGIACSVGITGWQPGGRTLVAGITLQRSGQVGDRSS